MFVNSHNYDRETLLRKAIAKLFNLLPMVESSKISEKYDL